MQAGSGAAAPCNQEALQNYQQSAYQPSDDAFQCMLLAVLGHLGALRKVRGRMGVCMADMGQSGSSASRWSPPGHGGELQLCTICNRLRSFKVIVCMLSKPEAALCLYFTLGGRHMMKAGQTRGDAMLHDKIQYPGMRLCSASGMHADLVAGHKTYTARPYTSLYGC